MTDEEWFRLPTKLRKRWFDDTDCGRREPSPEMVEAIEDERRHPERMEQRRQEKLARHERYAQEAREQLMKETGASWEQACQATDGTVRAALDYLRCRKLLGTK